MVGLSPCRLLEQKTQESYYNKIVARYMQFCTHHSKDLESAIDVETYAAEKTENYARAIGKSTGVAYKKLKSIVQDIGP